MVSQYPYILQVLNLLGGGYDENGNPIPPSEQWINYCRCRDEAGNGRTVTTQDGVQHQYSFLVQMPKGVDEVKAGTKVKVVDGSDVRASGEVIYSRKDQLHSRLWV